MLKDFLKPWWRKPPKHTELPRATNQHPVRKIVNACHNSPARIVNAISATGVATWFSGTPRMPTLVRFLGTLPRVQLERILNHILPPESSK
jgi:hypothetical protein